MHLALSVIAATATVLAVIWLIQFLDRRIRAKRAAADRRRRQARLLAWVKAVESSPNHQATAELPPFHLRDDELQLDDVPRETAARNKYDDAIYHRRSEALGTQMLENPQPYNVAYLYVVCHIDSLDSWLAFKIDAQNLGTHFMQCIDEALKRVRAGDQKAIRGFDWLMSHRQMITSFCKDFGIDPPRYPDS
ncbi:MAG: hypothetical protein WBP12_02310 [Candidatus Saccharimonas sp.]